MVYWLRLPEAAVTVKAMVIIPETVPSFAADNNKLVVPCPETTVAPE